MEKPLKIEISSTDGSKQWCTLIEKRNNQNGQMLYTFRSEQTGNDFLISKHGNEWGHLQGDLPNAECVKELGNYIDGTDHDDND
ncbi:hypothetical protein SAMN05216464_118100 [Mucilaginibacter pineti]|uniref:Uncharacterized protein n=1 Tax=Mucilaginibacter pineti TaxID=1391627 RepID=A0A1G7LAQ5_9SPHI|nr:hypothetical protein [Mucilaginibacter pineti]SDF46568.1 hypothetical protein SAMN05216464_118100 [Mucilaginibacter pineti]